MRFLAEIAALLLTIWALVGPLPILIKNAGPIARLVSRVFAFSLGVVVILYHFFTQTTPMEIVSNYVGNRFCDIYWIEACARHEAARLRHEHQLHKRESSDWQSALRTNTPESYERYLSQWPGGSHTYEAQTNKETLSAQIQEERDWELAREQNTTSSLKAYLAAWPNGKHLADADRQLSKLLEERKRASKERVQIEKDHEAWNSARRTNSITAIESYINQWPQGLHMQAARAALKRVRLDQAEEHDWNTAKTGGGIIHYNHYLENWPDGRFSKQAHQRIRELKEEEERYARAQVELEKKVWLNTKREDTATAYNAYLSRFPRGENSDDARARLALLQNSLYAIRIVIRVRSLQYGYSRDDLSYEIAIRGKRRDDGVVMPDSKRQSFSYGIGRFNSRYFSKRMKNYGGTDFTADVIGGVYNVKINCWGSYYRRGLLVKDAMEIFNEGEEFQLDVRSDTSIEVDCSKKGKISHTASSQMAH